jgi:hypothetical protein
MLKNQTSKTEHQTSKQLIFSLKNLISNSSKTKIENIWTYFLVNIFSILEVLIS